MEHNAFEQLMVKTAGEEIIEVKFLFRSSYGQAPVDATGLEAPMNASISLEEARPFLEAFKYRDN